MRISLALFLKQWDDLPLLKITQHGENELETESAPTIVATCLYLCDWLVKNFLLSVSLAIKFSDPDSKT